MPIIRLLSALLIALALFTCLIGGAQAIAAPHQIQGIPQLSGATVVASPTPGVQQTRWPTSVFTLENTAGIISIFASNSLTPAGEVPMHISAEPVLVSSSATVSASLLLTRSQPYTVVVGGTADPKNYALTIHNNGNVTIHNPLITLAGRDWSNVDKLLADAIRPGMTNEEKAWSIWQFARTNLYHFYPVSEFDLSVYDPVILYNAFGYAFCNGIAASIAALLERAGIPARVWNPQGGGYSHVVSEAYYDGAWHMFDADLDIVYFKEDNRTVAGVEDLINNPELVARLGPGYDWLTATYSESSPTAYVPGSSAYRLGRTLSWEMRPQESLTLFWQNIGVYHDDQVTPLYPEVPPPIFANGELVSRFEFANPQALSLLQEISNVQWITTTEAPFIQPITTSVPGKVVLRIASPYPIVSATLQLDAFAEQAGAVRVYTSRERTRVTWQTVDLYNARYRTSPWYVDEANLRAGITDSLLPSLRVAEPNQPAHLTYRFRRLSGAPQPLLVTGWFRRATSNDVVSLAISSDNVNWETVWTAAQTGYFGPVIDLSSRVAGGADFYLRFNLLATSGPSERSGFQSLAIHGIDPFAGEPAWASAGPFDGAQTVDLAAAVADPLRSAPYIYYVGLLLNSDSARNQVGLRSLVFTSTVQVSPASLPALRLGANQLNFRANNVESVALSVTHTWEAYEGTHPPPPPVLAAPLNQLVSIAQPITLTWLQTPDVDGDAIRNYHVQICLYADCRWPANSYYDVATNRTDPNWPVFRPDLLRSSATYYWRIKTQDETGLWSAFSPTAAFTTTTDLPLSGLALASPPPVAVGQPLTVAAGLASGSNAAFAWEMGDGAVYTGQSVTHTYAAPGVYGIQVTVVNAVSQIRHSYEVVVSDSRLWLPFIGNGGAVVQP